MSLDMAATGIRRREGTLIDQPVPREALLQATDCGLMVPGETVRGAIYQYIESKYHSKREEIPEKLDVFHKALEGPFGACAKNLYSRLDLNLTPRTDWTIAK